jgi:hypothetical protein
MTDKLINSFNQEVSVTYRDEHYLVRDNGAIFRKRRPNRRRRPLDDKWTLGNPCDRDGYMKISSLAVHRIVATAFHGEQPTSGHVVDHIDTNRRNNRPENLRWVTRLDNILQNPKTLSRIEKKWGSIEGLLSDPNPSQKTDPLSNRPWMREVEETVIEVSTIESLTPSALQRNWKTPSQFPMCPDKIRDKPLHDYASCLKAGFAFSRNKFGDSIIDTFSLSKDGLCLSVICKIDTGVKNWALAKVTYEDGNFVHENGGTYFEHLGALKAHRRLIGEPYDDLGESIDDWC